MMYIIENRILIAFSITVFQEDSWWFGHRLNDSKSYKLLFEKEITGLALVGEDLILVISGVDRLYKE
jgi:hypothetical protein